MRKMRKDEENVEDVADLSSHWDGEWVSVEYARLE
jgi:hypothetical protein